VPTADPERWHGLRPVGDSVGRKTNLLFFAGSVKDRTALHTVNVRKLVIDEHAHEPDCVLVDTSKKRLPNYDELLADSTFCLAPAGMGGEGWGRRTTLSILHGCIPVVIQDDTNQPFEELLDYERFAVRMPSSEIPQLVKKLRAMPLEEVKAKQAAMRCVWPRMTWSSVTGAVADESGADDAFASLLLVLARRLEASKGGGATPISDMCGSLKDAICDGDEKNVTAAGDDQDANRSLCSRRRAKGERDGVFNFPVGGAVCGARRRRTRRSSSTPARPPRARAALTIVRQRKTAPT